MQRFLYPALVGLGVLLSSQQHASAWINFKFSAGVNWEWQSGLNGCWRGLCNRHVLTSPAATHDVQQNGQAQQAQPPYQGWAVPPDARFGFTPTAPAPLPAAPSTAVQATPTSQHGSPQHQPAPRWSPDANVAPGWSNVHQHFYYYHPGLTPGPHLQQYRYGFSFGW